MEKPDSVILEGKYYNVIWENYKDKETGEELLVVGYFPPYAGGEIVGFGKTIEDAIKDLEKAYNDLIYYASDNEEWVKEWSDYFLKEHNRKLVYWDSIGEWMKMIGKA